MFVFAPNSSYLNRAKIFLDTAPSMKKKKRIFCPDFPHYFIYFIVCLQSLPKLSDLTSTKPHVVIFVFSISTVVRIRRNVGSGQKCLDHKLCLFTVKEKELEIQQTFIFGFLNLNISNQELSLLIKDSVLRNVASRTRSKMSSYKTLAHGSKRN